MTQNARLSTDIWSDDVTITPSPAVASSLPAAHLQDSQPRRKCRTTTTADQTFTVDLGQERQVALLCLYAHNLSQDATLQLQGATDTAFSDIVFDQTWNALAPAEGWGEFPWGMVGWGGYSDAGWRYQYSVEWIERTVARHWRLILSDSSNSDGYLEAGRLMLGDYLEFTVNIDWGASADWINDSKIIRTRSNAMRSDNREPYRQLQCSNARLDKIQNGKIMDLKRFRGASKDLLVSFYPEDGSTLERRTTMTGRLTEWSENRHLGPNRWATDFTFKESI